MSEPEQHKAVGPDEEPRRFARDAATGREASVLASVRALASAGLRVQEPLEGDDDVMEAVVGGLLDVAAARRVRRVRLEVSEQVVYEARRSGAPLELKAASEVAVGRALDSVGPVLHRNEQGGVSAVTGPLRARSGALDFLVLESEATGRPLDDSDGIVMATFCEQAAAALALREARELARLDPLTGCLNHGAMMAQLEAEIARAQRGSGRLSVVMLDLDDFKAVNERHGHPVADRLLVALSAALRGECRTYDSCCRYGGDEFVVILPDSRVVEATRTAERLREAVASARVTHEGAELTLTATAGVADWRPGESPADLLTRVDRALLSGKAAGKDTIGIPPPRGSE